MKTFLTTITVLVLTVQLTMAQGQDWKNDKKVAVLFGLTQPLFASGFNIEGNFIYKRFIFDYSHGASLNFDGDLVTNELQDQGIAIYEPYTTGFGLGYRLKEWLNIRVEPKWHRFEFYYDGEPQNDNTRIAADNSFSLGLGLYGFFQPFKNNGSFIKGLTVSPSVRFWPSVSSSFDDDQFTYQNKNTDKTETLAALDPGIGFTPWVLNLSIGYAFDLTKK